MTHDTDKLMKKVLSGVELTPDEQRQLDGAPELLELGDLLKAASQVHTHDEPPKALDSAILAHAHSSVKRTKQPLFYVRLALAAASAVLFTVIVLQLLPTTPEGNTTVAPVENRIQLNPQRPDESRMIKNQIKESLVTTTLPGKTEIAKAVPAFDWESDDMDKEFALLEAELFMDTLDYADAALVENF